MIIHPDARLHHVFALFNALVRFRSNRLHSVIPLTHPSQNSNELENTRGYAHQIQPTTRGNSSSPPSRSSYVLPRRLPRLSISLQAPSSSTTHSIPHYAAVHSHSPSPSHTFHANLSQPLSARQPKPSQSPDHLPPLYILLAVDFLNNGPAATDAAARGASVGTRADFGRCGCHPAGGCDRSLARNNRHTGALAVAVGAPSRCTRVRWCARHGAKDDAAQDFGSDPDCVTEYGPSVRIWRAVGE